MGAGVSSLKVSQNVSWERVLVEIRSAFDHDMGYEIKNRRTQ
jgi:hypothetical protein